MSSREFKFISPGVFVNEIDNSQLPETVGDVGPVIIGRAEQGPALYPTRVTSFEEFVQVFGAPIPGKESSDATRVGNRVGPTYGPYAAQAWLRNNSPITFVRLVGKQNADAIEDGEAGWMTTNESPVPHASQTGGAYGLWVFNSSSAATPGTLAAIWYVNTGSVALSGTVVSASTGGELTNTIDDPGVPVTNTWVRATANQEFKIVIKSGSAIQVDTSFNFSPTSQNFIRKRFNTNPILTNESITDSATRQVYWLGETFEDEVTAMLGNTQSSQYGVVVPLYGAGGTNSGGDFRADYSDPATGFFIGQDLQSTTGSFDAADTTRTPKLFRLRARNTGRWASRNLKISIADIRAGNDVNPYGTFSVLVRDMHDTDNRQKVLEQFNNCNLNPASENYIGKKIGDKFVEWDDEVRRWQEYGNFDNLSEYIYVDATSALAEGKLSPDIIPFGFYGPPIFTSWTSDATGSLSLVTGSRNYGSNKAAGFTGVDATRLMSGSLHLAATMEFPKLRLRQSASEGAPTDRRDVYFGVDTTFNKNGVPSRTIGDYTQRLPGFIGAANIYEEGAQGTTTSYVFTLDDMCQHPTGNKENVYVSGSRQAAGPHNGTNIRSGKNLLSSGSFRDVLDAGCDKFTTVLHGGFDGLDITEAEPFRNTLLTDKTVLDSYVVNSLRVAIDSLRDPEYVEFDIAAMPGITNRQLNRSLIDMCEDRGDALAIIDPAGGYVPFTENQLEENARLGSVKNTIAEIENSRINSSFGAAYYPWVQIQDTIQGSILWAPPSIAALGAMSYGQRTQELWFAPAGFTRGGLSANNAAGIPVVGVRERLVSRDRDKLYDANINPIAQFPAEGIVIFGQKTLQLTPSALDRINVRRLLIFLKRQISRIASTLLFDQNVQTTWNRFSGRVEPLLSDVRSGLGLSDYKLILDETTTTPDLVDRNILYAKILLKPARAIEFIAIDFVITDSGASFED